jgi:hypothetical protein
LEGFLGFEPRVVKLKLTINYRVTKSTNLEEMRAVPRLSKLYPGICLTTEENHGKTSEWQTALFKDPVRTAL